MIKGKSKKRKEICITENLKEPGKKKVLMEDLGTMSGGDRRDPHTIEYYITKMQCSEGCPPDYWRGNYVDGIVYKCLKCGKMSYRGVELHVC